MKKEFISSSVFVFADNLIISVTGWFFWVVVGKLATASDIGISTYLFTFSAFLSGVVMLGLEFSLVKPPDTSHSTDHFHEIRQRRSSFGSILIIEVIANVIIMPLIFIYLQDTYPTMDFRFVVCTVLIFIFTTISTISRYALMGMMATKQILLIDVLSICIRFTSAFFLLEIGEGVFAILFATLVQTIVLSTILSLIIVLKIGISFSSSMLRSLLKEGLSNFPGKISKMMIAPISVILLGAMKVDPASMGLFFISLIIAVVAATFGTSLSTMSLSSAHKDKDLMAHSLRFGTSLTAPLVTVLVVFPASVLGIINENYALGSGVLVVLGFSVVPSVVVFNMITRLNSMGDNKRLILIGVLELVAFLFLFLILVPKLSTYGAAIAILAAYLISCCVTVRWLEPYEQINIGKSIISIAAGIVGALVLNLYLADTFTIAISIMITLLVNHLTGVLRLAEIKDIGLMVIRK